ncbi:MAG: DNA/RNA non-specific endonuclease [Bacteroidales bacterium]|nr:DNA/RNA non-specific endonuclease [Bacteroidales bacterium]
MKLIINKLSICTTLFCLLVFAASCKTKTDGPGLEIRFDPSADISGEVGQHFFLIETDPDMVWTATSDDEWITIEPETETGSIYAIVKVDENVGEEIREGTVTVRAGSTQKTATLYQRPISLVDVVGETWFESTATTGTFEIITNLVWTARITAGSSFAAIGSDDFGIGNGVLRINVTPYTASGLRTATLQVSVPGQTLNITLTQGSLPTREEQDIPFRLELPEVKNKRWYVQHRVPNPNGIAGDSVVAYAMEYDTAQRHAVWVALVFNNALNADVTVRSNAWAFDPIIPRVYQSLNTTSQTFGSFMPPYTPTRPLTDGDRTQWRYDRGHIMASGDRLFSDEANRSTFYFSNMSPQVAWFNQQLWQELEGRVRAWANLANVDTLYVVKGAAINRAGTTYTVNGAQQTFAGAEIIHRLPQRNNVVVPKWWFMAIVQRQGNSFHGIAFWMENKGSANSGFPEGYTSRAVTQQYALTIRELEALTGINFFPNLKIVGEQIGNPQLEEMVETSPINWSRWPGVN